MKTANWIVAPAALALAGASMLDSNATPPNPGEPHPAKARPDAKKKPMTAAEFAAYQDAIRKTAGMVGDGEAQRLAAKYGLNVLNVTWEDTGRFKGSSVGPNISDMTIQVGAEDPRTKRFDVSCMPVIRYPNFSDLTCDLDPRDFTLLVGNQRGEDLRRVSLYDFLADPTDYLSNPNSWKGKRRTLLAERDSKVLVSAQACFLPVPKQGLATFNPVLFNYQSSAKNPAVLTILATREGTSVTIIDNKRDAFPSGGVWGQRLFHNADGQRASLTGQRLSDFVANPTDPKYVPGERPEAGLNMVMLIQVPLKFKDNFRGMGGFGGGAMPAAPMMDMASKARTSDVENAVIGHGDLEGPFTEIDNLAIERDPRFPVRVTVQFYKATSNGVVSEADMKAIHRDMAKIYDESEFVGSLVTDGETGRATEYEGSKIQTDDWWQNFWNRYEANMGITRWEAIRRLHQLLGGPYREKPVSELYLRDLLRKKA